MLWKPFNLDILFKSWCLKATIHGALKSHLHRGTTLKVMQTVRPQRGCQLPRVRRVFAAKTRLFGASEPVVFLRKPGERSSSKVHQTTKTLQNTSKQRNKRSNKQTTKQASKPASKQASTHTIAHAHTHCPCLFIGDSDVTLQDRFNYNSIRRFVQAAVMFALPVGFSRQS